MVKDSRRPNTSAIFPMGGFMTALTTPWMTVTVETSECCWNALVAKGVIKLVICSSKEVTFAINSSVEYARMRDDWVQLLLTASIR